MSKGAATVAFAVSDDTGVLGRMELHPQPDTTAVLMPLDLADNLPAERAAATAKMLVQQALHEAKRGTIAILSVLPFVELSEPFLAALSDAGFDDSGRLQKWQRVFASSQERSRPTRAGSRRSKEQPTSAGTSELSASLSHPDVFVGRHICTGTGVDRLRFDSLSLQQSSGVDTSVYVTRQNLHQFLALVLATADDFEGVPPTDAGTLLQTWELIDSDVQLVVALDQGNLSGIVVVNSQQSNEAFRGNNIVIEYLGVHPEKRRQGLGALLVSSVLTKTSQAVDCSVYVSATNQPAIDFYSHFGFDCVNESSLWTLDCRR